MKRILLHACCGPCSLMCVQALRAEGFEITGYFANPNIHPVSEYFRRREAMREAAEKLSLPMIWQDDAYNLPGWLDMVYSFGIAENQDYARCRYCYESRLALTCATAMEHGFSLFTTSLLYSRHQQHDLIAAVGASLSMPEGAAFFYRDFRPYWQEGIELSKEWSLYRQNYCACIFSEYERFKKKLKKYQT